MSGTAIRARSAIALVVANMVGVGVFTTSGFALHDLGDRRLVLVAWLLGGAIAMCGALSYGALALRFPASGGEYEYLRRTVHPLAGTATGIVSMLAGFSAPLAAAAHLLQSYGCRLFDVTPPALPWIGTTAIVVAAAMHGGRVGIGARLQDLVVGAKLLLAVAFVLLSLSLFGRPTTDGGTATATPFVGFATTMPWIYLAYSGWNAAAYIAGEVEQPRRNVPRAMLLGCALVTALYVAMNAVFLWSTDASALTGKPEIAAIAAAALLGRPGEVLVTTIVALALLTSITGMTMAGPRVYARMAAAGDLPAILVSRDGRPPRAAIVMQAGLALGFLWAAELQQLMSYIGWTLSLSAAATVIGLLLVRRREGAAAVPCPGWPWVPLLFVTAILWFAGGAVLAAPRDCLLGLGTLVLAVSVARFRRRRDPGASA